MPIYGCYWAFFSGCPISSFPPNSRRPSSRLPRHAGVGFSNLRLAVISPFIDKQHGTERTLTELLQRLASASSVDIDLYSQRVDDLAVSPSESRSKPAEVGRIFWRRVSSIPG